MARFLLGWELGGGRGHLVRLAELSRRLIGDGHEVVVAAQRLSPGFGFPPEARLWQAPVWPRLLGNVGALGGPNPNTMGDILVRLGLDTPDTLAVLVGAWEDMLRSVQRTSHRRFCRRRVAASRPYLPASASTPCRRIWRLFLA
jgi:rhamnosyltransferase subunit B